MTPARAANGRVRLTGVGVSPGVAIGPAYIFDRGRVRVPHYSIAAELLAAEAARFDAAAHKVRVAMVTLRDKAAGLSGAAEEELGLLLDAHLQMLGNSRLMRSVRAVIEGERINAEAAISAAIDQIASDFSRISDPYLAARLDDIREVGGRLIRALLADEPGDFSRAPIGAVLVGDLVSPADIALMTRDRVAGIAAGMGGAEGHSAIMARSRGLPTVLGIAGLVGHFDNGQMLIVDGRAGLVIVDPDPATLRYYEAEQIRFAALRAGLGRLAHQPATTRDHQRIALHANIELPIEIAMALEAGAEGVGLMRSEFLYMNRPDLPSEDEQYQAFRAMIEAMAGKSVTIRTLDAGADKIALSLEGHFAAADNPALGLRAIRLALQEKPLLETQLAALLRAAVHGPLRILLPMISDAGQLRAVRAMMIRTMRTLVRRGLKVPDPLPPLGAMIEIPGAALTADMIAKDADFLSIGTNDLTMYTLAVDRGNEQVADLYDPLHPAVLRLIEFTVEAGKRAGIPVNLCGEMAGDPRLVPVLLGLGVDGLSATPLSIPAVKQRIRELTIDDCTSLAARVIGESDTHKRQALLDPRPI